MSPSQWGLTYSAMVSMDRCGLPLTLCNIPIISYLIYPFDISLHSLFFKNMTNVGSFQSLSSCLGNCLCLFHCHCHCFCLCLRLCFCLFVQKFLLYCQILHLILCNCLFYMGAGNLSNPQKKIEGKFCIHFHFPAGSALLRQECSKPV